MRRLALVAVVLLSACAGATVEPGQCTAGYDLGFRDAIMGLTPQDTIYEPMCTGKGARLDVALYRQGWVDGHFEVEKRTPHTE